MTIKTERELLELAAKATGHEFPRFVLASDSSYVARAWNPLTDDGDAFRLAVKLKLDINFLEGYQQVLVQAYDFYAEACVDYTDDRSRDVRLAVVMAASAIGESMP